MSEFEESSDPVDWPRGDWIVTKTTRSGDVVRITPYTTEQRAERYMRECRALPNCGRLHLDNTPGM